jgi:CTP synthase
LKWIETTDIENNKLTAAEALKGVHGVIVPGGFGSRGTEGKIEIIKYVRENNVPFLGICLGLQLAVIEFARHKCSIKEASSTEFGETREPVIDMLEEQRTITKKGGTMRLGAYPAHLKKNSLANRLYGNEIISERHRHRYEVNPKYHQILEKNGLVLSGMSPDRLLVEFIELNDHPYFIGTQAHPELKSRLLEPAPLFAGLVETAIKMKNSKL